MKRFCCAVVFVVAVVVAGFGARAEAAQLGTGFTYQGQLLQNGTPTTGTCDLQFSLFDAASGVNQLGSAQTVNEVRVTDGLFTVQLNSKGEFGVNAFKGEVRWLQIGVSCPASASPSFTVLAPRQNLTAAPYALYASTAGSAGGLSCNGCVAAGAIAAGAVTENTLAAHTITARSLAFSPGTVTSITAGTGLTGGTISTSGTISIGMVPVANGGTGGSTAPVARGNLGAAASGANADITSLSGITGNIALPKSTSGSVGNILKGGTPFVHNFGTDNTFVGTEAGNFALSGSSNSALGNAALSSNTNGSLNSAVGDHALFSNTAGNSNNALGRSALLSNTAGNDNNAVGYLALRTNTSGSKNTAVGNFALFANTGSDTCTGPFTPVACCIGAGQGDCGSNNNAVGYTALYVNTTGHNNTAVGSGALYANTTGDSNTAVGSGALRSNKTSDANTAVGFNTLADLTSGLDNIALGDHAGHGLISGNGNTYIGAVAASSGESHTIRIGAFCTSPECIGPPPTTYIDGIHNSTSTDVIVFVNSDGKLGTPASSARFKTDIQDMGDSSRGLMQLRPVRFRYKQDVDPSGLEQYGLVAEEVAKVYPDLVANGADGQPYTVRYQFLAPMLLNEVQKQARQIEARGQQLTEQARRIADQGVRLSEQAAQLKTQQELMQALTSRLGQVEAALGAQACAPALGAPQPGL